jgi:stage II sporulation protein D
LTSEYFIHKNKLINMPGHGLLMIDCEPIIKVALLQNSRKYKITLNGTYNLPSGSQVTGPLNICSTPGRVTLSDASGKQLADEEEIIITAEENSTFTVAVEIGIDFHWQRIQTQTFHGNIIIQANSDASSNLVNEIPLEDYIRSVISSEMSDAAPLEFLKVQAITARSWLVAMLERKRENAGAANRNGSEDNEIIRWYDTNDHSLFDVCADDHCQRYQGIGKIRSANAGTAVGATRGLYLVSDNKICDARYSKACGGRTEIFATAWEDISPSYLQSVPDTARGTEQPVCPEEDAAAWLQGRPPAYCDTRDKTLLGRILPSFDQETIDFYRWRVIYTREELEKIIQSKSGIDFGVLQNLIPIERGPSGRISRLRIAGTKRTVVVGKELEIRRWLSPSHLLSSAFAVSTKRGDEGNIERFILDGGGWGHGVGLCQIGAAVMAQKGFNAAEILAHYFSGARLQKLYK